jgi:hypothetical protein
VTIRELLIRWQFVELEAQFLLFVALSWQNLPVFVRSLRLTRVPVTIAAAASLITLSLLVFVVPATNRIYFDEHIYQGVAQNLSDLHLAQMCNDGNVEYGRLQCRAGEYNKEPYGYPYLLSVLYRLVGVHPAVAHVLNGACAVLLVWVVFLIASALGGDPWPGSFAALVVSMIPQLLLWSGTAAVEPSATLMTAIAIMAALHFVRARTRLALVWMVSAAALAAQFRLESFLVIALIGLALILYALEELKRPRVWWAAGLTLLLCALHVVHLIAVRGEGWGASGARMSFAYLWPNFSVNGTFFIDNVRFPVFYSALALWGLWSGPRRAASFAAAYFAVFWGVFLFFYAGSYNYGADVRFSLLAYPGLAILAGFGIAALRRRAIAAGIDARKTAFALVAAVAVAFLSFMPQVRAVGEEAWASRADVAFVRSAARDLPANSIVLTHVPALFLTNGICAAQLSLALSAPGFTSTVLLPRYAGGVFVHWGYWCNVADRVQASLCSDVLDQHPNQLIRESREREYRYAFYRITPGELRLKTDLQLK